MPVVLGLLAWMTMLTVIIGFFVGHPPGPRLYALFCPGLYEDEAGCLLLGRTTRTDAFIVLALFALSVYISMRFLHAGIILLCVAFLLAIVVLVTQVGWLAYLYRMNIGSAVIFYVIILGAQTLTFVLVASSMLVGQRPSWPPVS